MLTLQNMPQPQDRYQSDLWAYGLSEIDAFDALPDTELKKTLAREAQNPTFLNNYMIPVLRTRDPYGQFMRDLAMGAITLPGRSSAFQVTMQAAKSLLPQGEWSARGGRGQLPFLDMLRSLTSDPAILDQGLDLEQKAMNARAAGSDTDLTPVLNTEQILINGLMKAKTDAQKAQVAAAVKATPSASYRQVAFDTALKAAKATVAEAARIEADPVAKKAKADADAAAASAKAAEKKAMQDKATAYAAARQEAYEQDIMARISRGEHVARAEYCVVYGRIKPDGKHPYVDWTAYEAANGRTYTSWFNKIVGPLVSIAGAVLAPVTGGLSLAAAAVVQGVMKVAAAKGAATVATNAASMTQAQQQAQTAQADAATAKLVDDFFNNNRPWFTLHEITPEAWSKMTLDQKIQIIKIAAGTPITTPTGAVAQDAASGQLPAQVAAQPTRYPSATSDPGGWGASSGGGGAPSSGAPAPLDYETPEQQAARAAAAPAGQYDIFIEGQKVGTYGTMPEATNAILAKSKRGDRLEIVYNGQSLGLRLRTSGGSIDVPADIEAAVRGMSHDKMDAIVTDAEKQIGASGGSGGVLPWLLLVGGGVLALAH